MVRFLAREQQKATATASVASLTIYDMLKGIDRGIRITDLELVGKAGGRSGTWRRKRAP